MGRIFFLIALFYIISRATSKKKNKSAAGKIPAAAPSGKSPAEGDTVYRDLFDKAEEKQSAEGEWDGQPRRSAKQSVKSTLKQIDASVGHHNVEASSISGHSHQETSMTGIVEECAPISPAPKKHSAPSTTASVPQLSFPKLDQKNLREGIILAEILGKPKSLKR